MPADLDHLAEPHDFAAHEVDQFIRRRAVDPDAAGLLEILLHLRRGEDRFSSTVKTSMIGFGVPAGATIICHDEKSKPGTPASAIVGMFAIGPNRAGDEIPSARILPVSSSGSTGVAAEQRGDVTGDESLSAGASPR